MKTSIISTLCLAVISAFLLNSCTSTPKEIPQDMIAQELIQKGQDYFEKGNYKESLRYYNAVIERYSNNVNLYIEASYEIGHLFMKQKKYEQAVPILEEIRDLYPKTEPGVLPPSFEKLAKIELAKVPQAVLDKVHAANNEE